jgi:hypothetical protein
MAVVDVEATRAEYCCVVWFTSMVKEHASYEKEIETQSAKVQPRPYTANG